MITRVSLDWLQVLGLSPAHFPGWIVPTLVFAGALGITLFAAAQYRRGIVLGKLAAREVRHLAWLVAYMGSAVLLLVVFGTSLVPGYQVVQVLLNLLIIGLFVLVVRDAMRRDSPTETEKASENPHPWESEGVQTVVAAGKDDHQPPLPLRTILLAMLALGITLLGVIIMVQAAEMSAVQIQLSPIILSLVVLAVATSLPNTVVAYQLARTEGCSTSVEEILSSNAINLTLGMVVPLLLWPMRVPAGLLPALDLPLLAELGLVVVAFVMLTLYSGRRVLKWPLAGISPWLKSHHSPAHVKMLTGKFG